MVTQEQIEALQQKLTKQIDDWDGVLELPSEVWSFLTSFEKELVALKMGR